MNKIILIFAFSLQAFFASVYGNHLNALTTIDGDLYFKVSQKHINANLQYQYVASERGVSEIMFYLTKDVDIDQLEGEAIEGYTFDKNTKPFATLTISFNHPLEKGTIANFTLSYSGILSKGIWTDNYGYIDIDPDFMILPLFTDFAPFNYKIHAALDDADYKFFNIKNAQMSSTLDIEADSVYYFQSIVAGNEMKFDQVSEGDYTINIISNKSDSIVDFLGNKSIEILEYFNNTFGQKRKVNNFTVLYRPLPDSIVIPIRNLTDEKFIMFSNDHGRIPALAHEIAHFWWNRGNNSSMEKWLSESFAEYSQFMYVRDTQGQNNFQHKINHLEKEVKNLPSLIQSDRFGKNWSDLLYEKGPYLLYQLEEMIGDEKFTKILSNLNEKEVSTTDAMLSELEEITSVETRNIFEDKLMK